jgi:hypothetical protein
MSKNLGKYLLNTDLELSNSLNSSKQETFYLKNNKI